MSIKTLLALILLLSMNVCDAAAQKIKFGVSAGLVKSFVYAQNFSTKGRYDYVKAEGQFGYQIGLQAEYPLGHKTAVGAGLRFLSLPTYYEVIFVVPTAFAVTHTWQAKRQNYRLYSSLSHVILERGNKKVQVFGGLLAGLERQQLQLDRTAFAFYETYANNLTVNFTYSASSEPKFLWGAEAGFGLRLFDGVDLNMRYNYNFTTTPQIDYTSTIEYNGPPGSPRQSAGSIEGRPVFVATDLIIWFN